MKLNKIYPIAVLIYLFPITLVYIKFNKSEIALILAFIPLIIRHSNPVLLIKQFLIIVRAIPKVKSINGEYSNYKQQVEEILKKYNLDMNVIIENNKEINLYSGIKTLYITKGFADFFSLNDNTEKKFLSILGHEISHQKRFTFIRNLILSSILFMAFFSLISILGIFNLFVFTYLLFISLYLLVFYLFRREEFEADKEGCRFAKDNTGLILFLKTIDDSVNKDYNLWDRFVELFSYHPHSINRIRKLENCSLIR